MDESASQAQTEGTATAGTTRVPPAVSDLVCPFGHMVAETTDRRWLWSAHEILTQVLATTDKDRTPPHAALLGLREEMGLYLAATCEHHWENVIDGTVDGVTGGGQRCLWCETSKPKGSWFNDESARP